MLVAPSLAGRGRQAVHSVALLDQPPGTSPFSPRRRMRAVGPLLSRDRQARTAVRGGLPGSGGQSPSLSLDTARRRQQCASADFQGCSLCGYKQDDVGAPEREVLSEPTGATRCSTDRARQRAQAPSHLCSPRAHERSSPFVGPGKVSGEGTLARAISPDTTIVGVHSKWTIYKKRVYIITHIDQ